MYLSFWSNIEVCKPTIYRINVFYVDGRFCIGRNVVLLINNSATSWLVRFRKMLPFFESLDLTVLPSEYNG